SMQLPLNRNMAPTATASESGSTCAADAVNLNGSGSDADGTIVRYDWDFEDDGTVDYTSAVSGNTTHVYGAGGQHRAKLTVRDDKGGFGFAVVTFTLDAAESLFVSASTGSEAGDGSRGSPFARISAAIIAGNGNPSSCPVVILVSNDTYNETLSFVGHENVLGGYNPATWTPSAGSYSIVNGTQLTAFARNISTPGLVSGLDIRASQSGSPGTNTVALLTANSLTSQFEFDDCKFTAAAGNDGSAGGDGLPGTNGA